MEPEMSKEQEVDIAIIFDITKVKKKKKKQADDCAVQVLQSTSSAPPSSTYSYDQMLDRVIGLLHLNNPELGETHRATIKPPELVPGPY
jgi:hypothetical protein